MDVKYQRGNPTSLTHGEHTIEYDFDKLNRLNKINNGLAEPIEYIYANDEEDLRMQQDDRTAGIYIDKAQSDLASTLYTRTTQTPWPHIIWNEALGQLQLASKTGIIPPDTVFLSAAKRRRLYDAVVRNKQSSKDFDKPSSSFWTPPEYLATNCDPTECMIYGVFFDPIGPIYLGQPVEISALAESDLSCEPNYTFYVDGQIVYSTSSFSSVPYKFNTAGNHEIKVISRCSCAESNVWGVWAFEQVSVQLPKVTVVTADITNDQIEVKLEPSNVAGNLTLSLVEDTGLEKELFNGSKWGGSYSFNYDIAQLKDGKTFYHVKATWQVTGAAVSHQKTNKFKVLGDYRHSRYNSPSQYDPSCNSSTSATVFVTTERFGVSQCFSEQNNALWYEDEFSETFRKQLFLNGSGTTILYDLVQVDHYCWSTPISDGRPANAINKNTFRQVDYFESSCGLPLNENTVAVNQSHPTLSCGDKVFINGVGVKTVTDHCPICTLRQLDNYDPQSGSCGTASDIAASAKTFKLLN